MFHNLILSVIAICRCFAFDSANAADSHSEIVIGTGSSLVLPAPGGLPVSVSDGKILRILDLGNGVRLLGRKPGIAAVSIGSMTRKVSVLDPTTFNSFQRLKNESKKMLGLEIEVVEGKIVVTGRLLRLDDWIRLSRAFRAPSTTNDPPYWFKATPDPAIRDDVNSHLRFLLRDSGLPSVDFRLGPAVAHLSTDRSDLSARVSRALGPYGFKVEATAGVLTLEPLVRVRILVTEVRRNIMRRLGVQWPGGYQAQLLPHAPPQPLTVQLNALEERGEGRILASPNLLCRSGKSAEFLAGGEFPIRLSGFGANDVSWKRYGVLLKISPLADHDGRMSIALHTEVSTIDASRSVEGLPGLLTNRIESHFDLKSSRTIALSGLIRNESGRSSSGIPGLSSLPVLGPLFSSRDFRDEKTELVVFVTPEVVKEDDEEAR